MRASSLAKGDIDSTEGIFNDFSHLSCTNIGNYDIALAETGIVRLHFLANLTRVSTYGTIVMDQLVNHIARDDAFRCMHKVDVFANHEAILLDDRTHEFVDSTGLTVDSITTVAPLRQTFITSLTAVTT